MSEPFRRPSSTRVSDTEAAPSTKRARKVGIRPSDVAPGSRRLARDHAWTLRGRWARRLGDHARDHAWTPRDLLAQCLDHALVVEHAREVEALEPTVDHAGEDKTRESTVDQAGEDEAHTLMVERP